MEKREIFIITGTRGSGKTLFINDIYDFLNIFEDRISGFVSKGIYNEEGHKEFLLKILDTNEEIHLASRHEKAGYVQSGKFFFNPEALRKGNQVVKKALKEKSTILIMDEIGPVELDEQVWHSAFRKVMEEYRGILIFSTRNRMLEKVIQKYNISEAHIEDIEETSPRKIGEAIMSKILSLQRTGKKQLSI